MYELIYLFYSANLFFYSMYVYCICLNDPPIFFNLEWDGCTKGKYVADTLTHFIHRPHYLSTKVD